MLEEMSSFFTARADGYDIHMLENVEGCREAYIAMAKKLPSGAHTLLDLGCGTGLELDHIFERFPDLAVTGIDMTQAMLDKLKDKHPDKALSLICASYFDVDFGRGAFDAAVSFQTMHHFAPEKKQALYARIRDALKESGVYIECDYMVTSDAEEAHFFTECARMRREQNIPDATFYHYDTPCTIRHQESLLTAAGFSRVETVFRAGNTTMIVAHR